MTDQTKISDFDIDDVDHNGDFEVVIFMSDHSSYTVKGELESDEDGEGGFWIHHTEVNHVEGSDGNDVDLPSINLELVNDFIKEIETNEKLTEKFLEEVIQYGEECRLGI